MAESRNVIWCGDTEPPHTWTAGILPTITLPDEATQRAGFYSEHAYLLIKNHEGYRVFIDLKAKEDASTSPVER